MPTPLFLDLDHAVRMHRSLIEIDDDEDGLVELTLKVATGQAGKGEIASFFRNHAH